MADVEKLEKQVGALKHRIQMIEVEMALVRSEAATLLQTLLIAGLYRFRRRRDAKAERARRETAESEYAQDTLELRELMEILGWMLARFFARRCLSARPWLRGGSATADRTEGLGRTRTSKSAYNCAQRPKCLLLQLAWFPGYPSHR